MTPAAGWILVGLIAVLVAAAIPALLQLRKTLKAAETTLETTSRHANAALDQLSLTLLRVNSAADELDRGVKKVSSLLEALGGLGDSLARVRATVGTVASVGSIVGGAVLAALGLRSRDRDVQPERDESPEPPEQMR